MEILHAHIDKILKLHDTSIDKYLICPHTEKDDCICRKPKLGLYLQAIKQFNVDIENSYAVGDKLTDILPAIKLGCNYALLLTGHGINQDVTKIDKSKIHKNLLDFALKI